MQYVSTDGFTFFQSKLLLDAGFDSHAFFVRGTSDQSFDDSVLKQVLPRLNRAFSLDGVSYMEQVHGLDIAITGHEKKGQIKCMRVVDGLITEDKCHGLLVRHADCQVALIADKKTGMVAALHVGWRAMTNNFFHRAFKALQAQFGISPKNCLVAISSSLGPRFAEFRGYQDYFPKRFEKVKIGENHFDLWKLARLDLLEIGVRGENIDIMSLCSQTHPHLFFSYRANPSDPRRNAAFIATKACLAK